jgi:hypothetical protein
MAGRGSGSYQRPGTTGRPAERPSGQPVRDGSGARRPGDGTGTRPEDGRLADRRSGEPGEGPFGDRRPGEIDDREDLEQRRDELGEKWEGRETNREEAREDWQDYGDKVRNERYEYAEKYYDEYWGWHHSHHHHHYHSSAVYVSLGCSHSTVIVSSHTFYYCGGTYYDRVYVQSEVRYVPVSAPSGAELESLENPTVMVIDGEEYYLDNGSFYQQIRRDGKVLYVVVDPPVNAEVPSLPEGARELQVGDVTYYQFDRVFYRKLGEIYVVVEPPAPVS